MNECPQCRLAAGVPLEGLAVLRHGPFVIHRRPEPSPVPGWLVVAPARHVEQIDALRSEELAALGPLLAKTAAALRAETPCEKIYVSVFAEVLPHLHFHVVARPPELPESERGPRLFLATGSAASAEAEALARRVQARLRPAVDPRQRALMLSALVCPGAGQLHNREYAKGSILVGLTLLATGLFFWRALRDVWQAFSASDPAGGPEASLALAEELTRRIGGPFVTFTVVLAVLWAVSVYDAYRTSRQR